MNMDDIGLNFIDKSKQFILPPGNAMRWMIGRVGSKSRAVFLPYDPNGVSRLMHALRKHTASFLYAAEAKVRDALHDAHWLLTKVLEKTLYPPFAGSVWNLFQRRTVCDSSSR
jgi:hypothetical protein